MPGLVPARRSYSAEDQGDEEGGIYDSPSPGADATPRPPAQNKRPRLNGDADVSDRASDDEDASAPDDPPSGGRRTTNTDSWVLSPPATIRAPRHASNTTVPILSLIHI